MGQVMVAKVIIEHVRLDLLSATLYSSAWTSGALLALGPLG